MHARTGHSEQHLARFPGLIPHGPMPGRRESQTGRWKGKWAVELTRRPHAQLQHEPRVRSARALGCGHTHAARPQSGQPGAFVHATNGGPGPVALGPRLLPDPWAAGSPDPEGTQASVRMPNGNALMMRMRPAWLGGGPVSIKTPW